MDKKRRKINLLLLAICCAMNYGCQSYRGQAEVIKPVTYTSSAQRENQGPLDITSIEFFAWCGEGSKRNYAKVRTLEVKDKSGVISPEKFDVVLNVENKSRLSIQAGDLILLTTMEFIVAPGDKPNADVNKIISEYTWARDVTVDDVKMALVPFLETGKQGRLGFNGFDLSRQNKVLSDSEVIEHVWAIKVTVHVLDRKMVELMKQDAIITIPS